MARKKKNDTGARIKAFRLAKGLRRAQAAQKAGISYDYFAKIENGHRSPNLSVLGRVLEAVGTTIEDFFGESVNLAPPEHGPPFPVEAWELLRLGEAHSIPVLGWTQAGAWSQAISDIPEEAHDTVYSDAVPDGCFALVVEGDSMAPEFSPGDIVIIDPKRSPEPGDFVVACTESESEATFKQFLLIKGQPVLHALNPAYPDIEIDSSFDRVIAGVVIETKRIFAEPDKRSELLSKVINRIAELSDDDLENLLIDQDSFLKRIKSLFGR